MKQKVEKPSLQPDLQPNSQDGKQEEASTDNEQKSNDFSFFVSKPDRSEMLTEKNDQTKKGEETDKSISFFLPE